jgi:hypothetical protein
MLSGRVTMVAVDMTSVATAVGARYRTVAR